MDEYRPPYGLATLTGLAIFGLYVVTLAPTTAFWDASEYIATAYILGIPHPPGNSLFVVLARAWIILLSPLGLPVSVRVNLFAAFTSAGAAFFWFLIAHRILTGALRTHASRLVGAGAAALVSATAYTVWNQSTVNEKVYTVSMLVMAWVTWLAFRWYDRRDDPTSIRYLVGAGYLVILGSTNHLMSVLPLPALGILVLIVQPGVLLKQQLWTRAIPVVLLGLSFNIFLPIRSAQDPIINEGEPTCDSVTGSLAAIYTNGKAGCPALADNLARIQYQKPPVTERNAPLSSQLLNYFQYFDWQWARGLDPSDLPRSGRLPVTLAFILLGLGGMLVTWRADRGLSVYMGVLLGTLTVGLVFYLNFKYGYSLAPEVTDPSLHEVRERDYFFIASFAFWGMLVGLGIAGSWDWLAERAGPRGSLLAAPVLALALLPIIFNWSWSSRSGDYAARDWAHDLLQSVEPYGVLFTNGDNDTFPLWYAQEVESIRQDVTVVVVQYLFTTWYPKQLQRHTSLGAQREFVSGSAAGLYDPAPPPPTGPILSVSPEDMDAVVGGRIGQDLSVAFGPVAVSYPSGSALNRGQLLALAIIRDSLGKRPIFFASQAGLMGSLGLDRWSVRHGLAVKFNPAPPDAPPDSSLVALDPGLGGGQIDVPMSVGLADNVLMERGFARREIWQDRATLNIPLQYYIFYAQLLEGARRWGASPEVLEAFRAKSDDFLFTWETGRTRVE